MTTAIMLVLQLFGVMMEMVTLWYFLRMILGKSKQSLPVSLLVFGLTGLLALGVSVLATAIWQRMLGYFCILLIPLALFDGKIWLKVFLNILFLAIGSGVEILTEVLFIAINGDLAVFTLKNDWGQFAQGVVIAKFLTFALIRLLTFFQRVKQYQLSATVMLSFSVLPVATALALNQLLKISYMIDQQITYAITFITIGLLIASNIILFYIFEKQAENEQTKLQLTLMQNQQEEQQKYYTQLAEEKMRVNRMTHDWSNRLLALSGYMQNQQTEEALAYLQEQKVHLQQAVCSYTGDMAIDTVLSEKDQLAKAQDATLSVYAFCLAPLAVSGIDIAILLANALDNALEATRSLPQAEIKLKLQIDTDTIDIILKNPLAQEVTIAEDTIATTKADKERHGIGLSSIHHIAEAAYEGDVSLTTKNGLFILDIMIMNCAK